MTTVTAVEIIEVGSKMVSEARNAQRQWSERRGLLLALRDDEGNVGQGEATPLPGYSRESLAQVRDGLTEWATWPLPAIDEAAPLQQLAELLERLPVAVPAARFAVETAWLDLVGQRLARPLYRLLAPTADPRPVAVAALMTSRDPAAAITEIEAAVERGITTIKVKVGAAFDDELAMLKVIRQHFGARLVLRLDANRTFPIAAAVARLEALAELSPELLEEPVAEGDLPRLAADLRIAGGSPVPLAFDETLQRPDAWEKIEPLLASGSCRALVLKPMALGGALACLRLAEQAARRGLATLVTHLFDGPVGLLAAAHLAFVLPGESLACGLARHAGLTAWPEVELTSWTANAIRPVTAPGLGIDPLAL